MELKHSAPLKIIGDEDLHVFPNPKFSENIQNAIY
jgi:hypothetical protein